MIAISGTHKGCVWITRTQAGAFKSSKAFQSAGYETVTAPLLYIAPAPHMPSPPPHKAILVFTSRNGLSTFCDLTDRRHWSVVTVGDATARAAQLAGFETVNSASGTWEDVVSTIESRFPDRETPIFHIAGNHVRGRITETLNKLGYTARRDIYYSSDPIRHLPDIDMSSLTHIALYSPLAAKTLAWLKPQLGQAIAVSISAATDIELSSINFRQRRIAAEPNEKSMLTALDSGGI